MLAADAQFLNWRLAEVDGSRLNTCASGTTGPQDPNANRGCRDALLRSDFPSRQAAHLLFKENPVPGTAQSEDSGCVDGRQIDFDLATTWRQRSGRT
jgi:hypothetical protein